MGIPIGLCDLEPEEGLNPLELLPVRGKIDDFLRPSAMQAMGPACGQVPLTSVAGLTKAPCQIKIPRHP